MKSFSLISSTAETEYQNWLNGLKTEIRQTQIKAALRANYALIRLYWQIGSDIQEQQMDAKWGSRFFDRLSQDLKREFPEVQGFSVTNLKYMKRFYKYYSELAQIRHQAGDELLSQLAQVPWRHNVEIMTKSQSPDEALFYVQKTIENGWSRSVLVHQIESGLFNRSGKAISNFSLTLSDVQSDLAQEITKDPYVFDLMGLTEKFTERELEDYLAQNMTRFLLELGTGFTFYGRQVHLDVNGDDFFIDLLFYHVKLHCFVVVELKTVKFSPEHVGQLKFYVTAVDRNLRTESDEPTIGLLICKDKNDVVAEYTLQDVETPIGVSSYETFQKLTEKFRGSLPTIEEIEKQFKEEPEM